ncbi:FtsW/RodA/SpoVE family cell cycle protein [uncultured Faecalibaculum sp.]|uniref:FtsW/RodA/SpoVE family cell cycle protein n=1 Tax=uncultured Faecalibaculum sp. TaxID=1729681 RepID=UPI0025E5B272|nr:FtsW/RodA/SpoVE family cell cycle protein [uncultured Faecalibaculum sp.]
MHKAAGKQRDGFSLHLCSGYDKGLMAAVWILIIFGTCMIASTAVGQTTSNAQAVLTTLIRQLVFITAGYGAMWLVNRVFTMQRFFSWRWLIIIGYLCLMGICFVFPAVNGSHAWINLKLFTLQPSEFGKPLMILLVASSVWAIRRHPRMKVDYGQYFRLPLLFLLADIILLTLQKDFGTLTITAGIYLLCASIPDNPGIRKRQRSTLLVISLIVIAAVGLMYSGLLADIVSRIPGMEHIAVRIENTVNPYTDVYGAGYQPANALYSIGSSNFLGRGFGNSARKYGYLTQADNDYILAVIIEELGVFGLGVLTLCYAMIEYKLFGYALKTRDTVSKVILAGTGTYIFLHFLLNVGGVSGLIPMTGIPLLFISSGGSSLLAASMAIGICQRVIARIRRHEMGLRRAETEFSGIVADTGSMQTAIFTEESLTAEREERPHHRSAGRKRKKEKRNRKRARI